MDTEYAAAAVSVKLMPYLPCFMYVCMCVHMRIRTYVRMEGCMYVSVICAVLARVYLPWCGCASVRTYVCTYMYACISCLYVCMYECTYICVHTCVCIYVCMYTQMRRHVCVCICVGACMHVCVYMCACVRLCVHASMHDKCSMSACMHAGKCAFKHKNKQTKMYTHRHTDWHRQETRKESHFCQGFLYLGGIWRLKAEERKKKHRQVTKPVRDKKIKKKKNFRWIEKKNLNNKICKMFVTGRLAEFPWQQNYRSLLQNIMSFIGLFCKRKL